MSDHERASQDVYVAMRAPDAFARAGFVVSTTTVDRTLQIDVRIPSTAIRIRPAGANERATFRVHAELQPTTGAGARQDAAGQRCRARFSPDRMKAIRASDKLAVRLDSPAPPPGTYLPHRRRPRQRRVGRREDQRADRRAIRARLRASRFRLRQGFGGQVGAAGLWASVAPDAPPHGDGHAAAFL